MKSLTPPQTSSFTATLVALFLIGLQGILSAETEKITNGDFESMPALSGWQTNKWGGDGTISATRDTSGDRISGNASAKISIGGGGNPETAEWWELVFTQDFELTNGRFYNGSFKIRASEPVQVQVLIQRTSDPFTAYAWKTFTVGTEVQTERFSGLSSDTTTGAIRFFFGKTKRNTQIWIDDVSVMETEASGTTATVTVDFNAPETAADLTGLLSGMGNWYGTDSTQPGQQFIDPLRLKHWRVHQSPNFEFIDRAIASGAMPIVIRSLNWWAGSTPGNTNTPWADGWAALDAEFDALATRYGTDIIYEVWNEPDLPDSFANYEGGTFEKYLEMFERMHNRIRAIVPDAYIIGPSLSEAFDWFRLHQFMQFCVDNNLTVQGMSVHMWDDDAALADMREDLLRVRSEIMENPAYEEVGMTELFVTEYAYDEMRMRPGSNLAMVRFMEEGLVDGATSSCWTHLRDCTEQSSCFDGTLAGMLTCGGTAPRPLWWAKKWYADSVGGRITATSDNGTIVPIASNDSGRGQVILASRGYNGVAQDMTSLTVNLNNLVAGGVVDSDGTHDVWVYRAPFEDLDVAHDALWDPELIASTTVSVSGGNASLTLNNEVNAYDAVLIVFEEPEPVDFRPYGTWTGDSNNDLNTALNWTGEAVPASGAIATWSGEQAGPQTLTLAAAVGGDDGWKFDFTADQVDHLAIQNAAATSQILRLRTGDGNVQGNSLDIAAGAGAVTIGGGDNPLQVVLGPSDATTSTAEIRNNSPNKLTFAENASLIRGGTGARNLWIRGSGDVDILGNITLTGSGNLSMWGSGTLRLEGDNSAASIFRAAGDGTVVFTQAEAINNFTEFRIGFTGQSGILRYVGSENAVLTKRVRVGEGNGSGSIESSGSGTLSFSHADFIQPTPSTANINLTLAGTNTGDNTISGRIINHSSSDATRTLGIIKEGSGRWILSGANTYSGDTTVSEGHLRLAHANALGNSTLEIRGGVTEIADGITAVPGTGKIANVRNTGDFKSLAVQATGSASAIFNGDVRIIDTENRFSLYAGPGDTLTISGNLHSNAAATQRFTKTGEGTVILSGADTAALRLQGENIVAAGRLLLNGNMTNATGSFTVQDGAAIGGNGIWGGALTLASGGGLAFDSGATITVNGTANLGTLRVANISGLDSTTSDGTYPLLTAGTLDSSSLQNLGPENATTFGNKSAWFEVSGDTLNLHVTTAFTFTVDEAEATITDYNGPGGLVRVPDELDGNPVVAIGADAFQNNTTITRLTLPASITELGDSAFAGASGLQWILFRGDAPSLGSDVFAGISADIYYRKSTSGWDEQAGFGGLAIQRWDIAMNRVLGRGINFGNSFDAPSESAWGNPWQPEYFETIGAEDFDHIRLPVRWEPANRSMDEAPFTIFPVFFERIKEVVDKALAEGLPVVLNMHHHDELFYTEDPADFAVQRERYIAQWAQIAEFFDDYPEDLLFFELMNEPHGNVTPAIWNDMIVEGLAEVRAVNPDRMVLIGTALRGGINGLAHLVLPADDALILTPHYYEPFTFTHQSSHVARSEDWAGTEWRDSDIERQAVLDDLAIVTAFAEANDIPVYLGEFGVIQFADLDSRVRYLRFLTRTFESLDMSWAVWQFTSGFTVTDEETKQFIPKLLNALLHDELPEANVAQLSPVYTSNFSAGVDSWTRNVHQGAAANLTGGSGALTLDITNGGSAIWHVQLRRSGINLQKDRTYRVILTGSSLEGLTASTSVGLDSGTFTPYSSVSMLRFPPEGITHTFFFRMNADSDSNARINLDIGLAAGTLVLSEVRIEEYDVLLRPIITTQPTASVLTEGQTLDDASLDGGAADVDGVFTFSDPSIVPPVGTSQQEVTFTPTDTTTHTTTTFFVEVTVQSAFESWIDSFFPGETDPAIVGPDADPDGDGLTNEQEWLVGTDPSDPTSRFTALQEMIEIEGSAYFQIQFDTRTGRIYQVQRSTTLASDSWENFGDPISGDGEMATVEDSLIERAFYRVRVEWVD